MEKQQVTTQTVANNSKLSQISSTDVALLAVRVMAGIIFMVHGAQQLFGAFDGGGLTASMSKYGPGGGGITGLLVAIGLFFGGLGILTGGLTRFSAAINILIMMGAIMLIHAPNGFFLVDAHYKYLGGYEFNLVLIGLCLPLVISGAGALSLDRFIKLPARPTLASTQRAALAE